jgi:hypothetical protein
MAARTSAIGRSAPVDAVRFQITLLKFGRLLGRHDVIGHASEQRSDPIDLLAFSDGATNVFRRRVYPPQDLGIATERHFGSGGNRSDIGKTEAVALDGDHDA